MIKRCAAVLAILFALQCPSALTEPVLPAATTIVGRTGDGEYIQAYEADNGQTLYFTSALESPAVTFEDINFDGTDDISFCTATENNNTFSLFFVYHNGMYILAEHPGLSGQLCNYQLFPEAGLVLSCTNHGMEGLLHETCIFSWDGPHLRLLRRATAENHSNKQNSVDSFSSACRENQIRLTVTHYTPDRFNGFVVWEKVIDYTQDNMDAALAQENDYLWHNLI